MRRNDGFGWVHAVALVAAWRVASELLLRRRELARAGVLEHRVARRRADRVSDALERLGLPAPRPQVLAAVHVGGVSERDVDDVALLDGSMRRAVAGARPRAMLPPPTTPATDWGRLLEGVHQSPRARTRELEVDLDGSRPGRVPAWAIVSVAAGVALTAVALVRPLEAAAPMLAGAGLALAITAWLGARRG